MVITENFNVIKVCCETVVTCVEPEKCVECINTTKFQNADVTSLLSTVTGITLLKPQKNVTDAYN